MNMENCFVTVLLTSLKALKNIRQGESLPVFRLKSHFTFVYKFIPRTKILPFIKHDIETAMKIEQE